MEKAKFTTSISGTDKEGIGFVINMNEELEMEKVKAIFSSNEIKNLQDKEYIEILKPKKRSVKSAEKATLKNTAEKAVIE